jgi:soluble lytic murein transglycosylase-like protein
LIEEIAPRYGLDPKLVLAVVSVESAFQADAISSRKAQGLMQLIPATAARFGVRDPFNPVDNLRGGMAYLRWLLTRFKGRVTLALAAYNAGEGAVKRYGGVPPYKETRKYVKKIRALYSATRHPF